MVLRTGTLGRMIGGSLLTLLREFAARRRFGTAGGWIGKPWLGWLSCGAADTSTVDAETGLAEILIRGPVDGTLAGNRWHTPEQQKPPCHGRCDARARRFVGPWQSLRRG